MKIKVLFILILSVVLLTACMSKKDQLPTVDDSQLVTYGVAGYITEITSDNDNGLVTILVEGELGKNGAEYDKAYVKVTQDTIIYGKEELIAEDLELNQYVNVFFEGAVMESYPVQASAKQINIVPEEAINPDNDPTEE